MPRAILKLNLKGGSYEVPILKVLKLTNGVGFLSGTENSDHEFWTQFQGEPVMLAGTFKEATFHQIRKAKTRDIIDLQVQDFEWINPSPEGAGPIRLECVTLRILKLDLSQPLAAVA
jgi:hypothetical protein